MAMRGAHTPGHRRRHARTLALGVVAVLAAPLVSFAAGPSTGIYLVDDGGDAIHLTDRADEARATLLVGPEADAAVRAPRSPRPSAHRRIDPAIEAAIADAARAWNVAADLLHGVIAVESAYLPRAVSPRGALGLMQLMPATARALDVSDPFDVRENVFAGARLLRRLGDRFPNDAALVLAAYNAGEGAVERHAGAVPPYAETVAYVQRVLRAQAAARAAILP